ncbi:OmpA family protein [Apibacter mensalis]|uniref:OmpA family protein n=1 Tax=Apibacter mensalis TaxID=1586267 RepID=A0A0X3APP0_9FLAO|nr:OmpA family protein [Apibacter mensalis]CVK16322.1 OmpA family protein [Apibacter mensalis]
MENLLDSLKKIITPEAISNISSELGEDTEKVKSAIKTVVPSLFGAVLEKGNDNKLENILKQAVNIPAISNSKRLFTGQADAETQKLSSGFLNNLFGDKLGNFFSLISSSSGLKNESTTKLLGIISPLVASFLGQKLQSGGNFKGLLGQINSEKNSFLSSIPSGFAGILGLSSISGIGDSFFDKVSSQTKEAAENVKDKVEDTYHEYKDKMEKHSGMGWLKWLIIFLLAVILIIWLFSKNGCSKSKGTSSPVNDSIQKTEPQPSNKDTVSVTNTTNNQTDQKIKELLPITLPSGTVINAFPGGIEDQMVNFLQSDEYKNATNEDLKNKWFDFDAINFEFGSGTKLTPESETQAKNIGIILKEFPDVKVKIGAYTDKKGNEQDNLKLSEERANTVKEIFVKNGFGDRVEGVEGYGSKFAKVDANASDEERAKDRRISLRLEK